MADLSQAFSEIKSLPDHVLEQELSSPSGMIPGWLALGEIHERKAMRATHGGDDPSQRPSMAEQYAGNIQKTVAGAGLQGQMGQAPQMGGQMGQPPPQPGPPQGPPQGIAGLAQQMPQGYANGGIVSLANGGQVSIEDYIRQRAPLYNIDPDVAIRVARSEGGLKNPFRHGEGPAPKSQLSSLGATENSYGPFQLYVSGTGAGLGDRAVKAGIDPSKDWQGGTDYALNEISQKGWGQWYGAKGQGITGMMGIGGRPANAPVPVATMAMADPATTAAATTATDVATTAADTAGKVATSEAAAGGDTMSQMLLASQLMGSKGQPAAAPPSGGGQVAQARPVDARLYMQDPVFMERMRSRGSGYG